MIIIFDYLYLENHSHIKRYARYTNENAHIVLNLVKYRKPINANNLYFIIIQNNETKRKKDIIYNPKNPIRKKCMCKMSDEGSNTGPSAHAAAT